MEMHNLGVNLGNNTDTVLINVGINDISNISKFKH